MQLNSFLFESGLQTEIDMLGVVKQFEKDRVIMEIGAHIKSVPLILNGSVKVVREDEKGHELVLYYLESGDTCAVTLSCCMRGQTSGIRAIAETDAQMVFIPLEKMEEWVVKYKSWRSFVFESYELRMHEMMETIDALAFLKLDERLLKYLREKAIALKETLLPVTHQEIAQEMGASRVVISRILKKLERDEKVKLHRNKVELLDL